MDGDDPLLPGQSIPSERPDTETFYDRFYDPQQRVDSIPKDVFFDLSIAVPATKRLGKTDAPYAVFHVAALIGAFHQFLKLFQ